MSKRIYELVEGRSVKRGRGGGDVVEEELEAEERELAREARRLRLQALIAKRRREIERLSPETVFGGQQPPSSNIAESFVSALLRDPKVQEQWLKLDEAQRSVILSSVATLMHTTGLRTIGAMFPLMISAVTARPSMGPKEVIEIVKTVESMRGQSQPWTLKDMTEFAKALREGEGKGVYERFVEPLIEEVKALREALAKERMARLEQEIQELKARPGFAEELAQKKAELEALRDVLGGGATRDVEIEKMRIDLEKWKAEKAWEMEKWKMEMGLRSQLEEKRLETITRFLAPTLERISPLVDAVVEEGQSKLRGRGRRRSKVPKGAVAFTCFKCGETVTLEPPYPDSFTCPKCGQEFHREFPKGE